MHTDASERLRRTLISDPQAAAEWTATLCLAQDPRIAGHMGALARKYSIDELPQLWNVLVGEMSLVGPRPLEPNVATTLLDERRGAPGYRLGRVCPASGRSAVKANAM
ncbi:MAG: sugar transferase [Defluviicoccus sp.]|nr:MAG: sugar transferase [Defluviicoccus sp.]